MAAKGTKGATTAPAKKAEQAATTAAPAAAEQQANQPAAITGQPASEAPTGLETGNQGPDAPTVLIVGDLGVGAYIEALKARDVNVLQLADLNEPLLREVGQFVEIEQCDVLPPEQLILLIGQKVGIEPQPYPPGVSGGGADNALDDDGDVEGLWVTAIPEQGFRRCGFRFTREGVGIALTALTAEQLQQLETEPNLKVERGIFGGRVGVQ